MTDKQIKDGGPDLVVVASYNKSAPTKTSGKGHQWWRRDVMHIMDRRTGKTLCGRKTDGWMIIDDASTTALTNTTHCCKRCGAMLKAREGGDG